MESQARTLRSGELARITGVSRDALRYYERHRLLKPAQRTANGYRRYPEDQVARVQLIKAALGIGFTVDELSEILTERDSGAAPCTKVHALAKEKAQIMKERIAEMQRLLDALEGAIRSWSKKLQATGPHKRAGLLEMFVANHPASTQAISPLISPGLQRRLQRKNGKTK